MSLFSALNAAVSALRAQGARIAAVSENIANTSTTAYKTRDMNFRSLVTSTGSGAPSGGVLFDTFQNLRAQGLVESTGRATNVALNGNGYFVVADNPSATSSGVAYSRNGSFTTDKDGFLINSEGYYLMGQPTDAQGNLLTANANDLSSLSPVNTQSVSGSAQATTEVEFDANIPADAAPAASYETSFEIYDNLGVSHTIGMTWTKTANPNEWTLNLGDPALTNTPGTTSGSIANNSFTIQFNGDGSLNSIVPATNDLIEVDFTGPGVSGSSNVTFNLNLGTPGATDGVTQFSSNSTDPQIAISLVDQNGVRFGRLSEVLVDDSGLVSALFDNGLRQAIYQIPVATFANPNGLEHLEGTVYAGNQAVAGNFVLNRPGSGNAGTITASALELSSTDSSEEFNKMIVAQQGYSSAAQVISTADEMFDNLIRAVQ
tara:strand:+ start:716 stop:2011 length:1296 start_codon:yes stop_codon:yes gene_type:complete